MNVHVIINPAAGSEESVLFKMIAFFQEHDIDYRVSVTTRNDSAEALARSVLEDNVDAVVGYGGDGTMMGIANALHDTDVPLLIVPGGTANVLSQELHIPTTIPKALSLLLPGYGHKDKIDIGRYKDTYFLTNLGVGIPAQWVKEANRELKNKYGLMAYIVAGVKATIKSKLSTYKLTLDGKEIETEGITCMIANIGSTGFRGLRLSKDISVTDGLLDVIVFKLKLYENFLERSEDSWFSFKENGNLLFEHHRAKSIKIVSEPVQPINMDGEMAGETPVEVSIAPKSLSLYRPTTKAQSLWDRFMSTFTGENHL